MLDHIQYEFRFFQNTLADPESGAGAETLIFRLQLRLWPKVTAPAGSGSATLPSGVDGQCYFGEPWRNFSIRKKI